MTNETNKNDGISIYQVIYNIQRNIATSIKTNATNPFHKSKYIDLYKLMEVLMPYFEEYNILITHSVGTNNLETKLVKLDTGEEYSMASYFDASRLDAQQLGSYITYMRRYAICCLFGIVADKDDDGNAASGIPNNNKLSVKKTTTDKKKLTKEEFESPLFTSTLDTYLNEGTTPKQILDRIKVKYTLTEDQEATILNLK